jgi:hypothetical protein
LGSGMVKFLVRGSPQQNRFAPLSQIRSVGTLVISLGTGVYQHGGKSNSISCPEKY